MDRIKKIVGENAERLGLLMLEFSIQGEKIEAVLCRKGGSISIGDLETVSRFVSQDLAKLGLEGAYEINLLSPGLDRVLKSREEMDIFVGKPAKFIYIVDGKVFSDTGLLRGNSRDNVLFETPSGVKEIPFEELTKVSLFVEEFSNRKDGDCRCAKSKGGKK